MISDIEQQTRRVKVDLHAGVGFEDCSAKITSIEESDFTNNSFTAWHNYVPGGQWDYYAFNVSSSDFHVVARAILEVGNEG